MTNTTKHNNTYLSEKEQEIQSLAYYGSFFASLDFSDAWKSIFYKQLCDFIVSNTDTLKKKGILITKQEVGEKVYITLKSAEHSEDNFKEIFRFTKELQEKYFLQSQRQFIHDGVHYPSFPLPIEPIDVDSQHSFYPRLVIQEQMSKIESLKESIESNTYILDQFQDNSSKLQIAQTSQIKGLIQRQKDAIIELEKELERLIDIELLSLAQRSRSTPTRLYTSRNDANNYDNSEGEETATEKKVQANTQTQDPALVKTLQKISKKLDTPTPITVAEKSPEINPELLQVLTDIKTRLGFFPLTDTETLAQIEARIIAEQKEREESARKKQEKREDYRKQEEARRKIKERQAQQKILDDKQKKLDDQRAEREAEKQRKEKRRIQGQISRTKKYISAQKIEGKEQENISAIINHLVSPIQEILSSHGHQTDSVIQDFINDYLKTLADNDDFSTLIIGEFRCKLKVRYYPKTSEKNHDSFTINIETPINTNHNIQADWESSISITKESYNIEELEQNYKEILLYNDHFPDGSYIQKEFPGCRVFRTQGLLSDILTSGLYSDRELKKYLANRQEHSIIFKETKQLFEQLHDEKDSENPLKYIQELYKDSFTEFKDINELHTFLRMLISIKTEIIEAYYNSSSYISLNNISIKDKDIEVKCVYHNKRREEKDVVTIKNGKIISQKDDIVFLVPHKGSLISFGKCSERKTETLKSRMQSKKGRKLKVIRESSYRNEYEKVDEFHEEYRDEETMDRMIRKKSIYTYEYDLPLNDIPFAKDIIKLVSKNYAFTQESDKRFILSPVIGGAVLSETYEVKFEGNMIWNKRLKVFQPEIKIQVIPVSSLDGDALKKLSRVQNHLKAAIKKYSNNF